MGGLRKLWNLLKIMRPLNLFQGAIAVLVTATLFPQFPRLETILWGMLIVLCYTGAGNTLNDYFDYEIDKINRPERPLPAGNISRGMALLWAVLLFMVGTLLGLLGPKSLELLVIMGIALVLLITYTPLFKPLPLLGNLIVAAILGMAFIFSAALFGNWLIGLPPALLAFGFNFIREIVKDMQDIEGDAAIGANTFPIKVGLRFSSRVVAILILVLILGTFLPYLLKVYGHYYLGVVIFLVDIPLIFVVISILRDWSPTNCGRLAQILKGDVFFGLLAIYVGKF